MGEVIAIRCELVKEGEPKRDLLVYRYNERQPSPCVVAANGFRTVIGGHIESVEQIYNQELAKRPGYCVVNYEALVATA